MATKSFYEMALENAQHSPDSPGLSSLNFELTHSELAQVVTHIATTLAKAGVVAGSRVATTLDSELDLLAILALNKIGAVSASIAEGLKALENLADFHIVKADSSADLAIAGAKQVFASNLWISEGKTKASKAQSEAIAKFHKFQDSDIVRIFLTSGTTAEPKAVCLSHEAMFRKAETLPAYWFQFDKEVCLFPPAAIGGFGSFICALALGKEVIAILPFSRATVAFAIRKGVQALTGSPLQISGFLDHAEKLQLKLPGLAKVRLAGGPVSEPLLRRLRGLNVSAITSHYGSTECGGLFIRDVLTEEPLNFLGTSYKGTEIRIVSEPTEEVSLSKVGLLEYKSIGMFSGYLLPDGSMHPGTTEDGFYSSGDQVEQIAGKFLFKGREDDILNIGGVSLNALPIEVFAKAQKDVEDAVCFALTDPKGKSWLAMAIVAEGDFQMPPFADALNAEFPHNSPRYISKVTTIPRTETGKPIRRHLVSLFESRVFQPGKNQSS